MRIELGWPLAGHGEEAQTGLQDRTARALVLDTNIVLDLLVFADPDTALLRQLLQTGALHWVATAPMRNELERVLAYAHIAPRVLFYGLNTASVLSAFDAQVRSHRRHQLLQLGGVGIVGHQQTPLIAINGAGLDGRAQHRRYQKLHQLVTRGGFACQSGQTGERWCFAGGLFDGDGVMPAVRLGHESDGRGIAVDCSAPATTYSSQGCRMFHLAGGAVGIESGCIVSI